MMPLVPARHLETGCTPITLDSLDLLLTVLRLPTISAARRLLRPTTIPPSSQPILKRPRPLPMTVLWARLLSLLSRTNSLLQLMKRSQPKMALPNPMQRLKTFRHPPTLPRTVRPTRSTLKRLPAALFPFPTPLLPLVYNLISTAVRPRFLPTLLLALAAWLFRKSLWVRVTSPPTPALPLQSTTPVSTNGLA
jgi:hypothetical protein